MTKLTKLHVRPAKTQIIVGEQPSLYSHCRRHGGSLDPKLHFKRKEKTLLSDQRSAQADLNLCATHIPFCWFVVSRILSSRIQTFKYITFASKCYRIR